MVRFIIKAKPKDYPWVPSVSSLSPHGQSSSLSSSGPETGPVYRHFTTKINPSLHSQLTFDKGNKNKQWNKDSLVNKQYWENLTNTCKIKLYHLLTFLYKNKLKMD